MISKILAAIYILIFLASSIFIVISLINGDRYIRQHVVMLMVACLAIISIIATIQFFFGYGKGPLGELKERLLGTQKERVAQAVHIVLFVGSMPVIIILIFWWFLSCSPWSGELKRLQPLANSGNPIYSIIFLTVVLAMFGLSLMIDWIVASFVVGFILRTFMSKQEARVYFQKIRDETSGLRVIDWIVAKTARFYFWLLEKIWR